MVDGSSRVVDGGLMLVRLGGSEIILQREGPSLGTWQCFSFLPGT